MSEKPKHAGGASRTQVYYEAIEERLADLVSEDDCRTEVPACPGWRVHDVVAHLAGLCEDWVDHRLDGYASDSWTADQVSRHGDRTCKAIFEIWAEAMTSFARLDESFLGAPPARWAFGDAVIHEADIRGALGAAPVPLDAVLLSLRGTVLRWHGEVLAPAGLPTLHIQAGGADQEWWLGLVGDPDAVVVEAPAYEIFRALAGRRSQDQVRAWTWSSDSAPFIASGLPYPFQWASQDLIE